MSYYDEDWKEDLIEEMIREEIREERLQEEEDMSNDEISNMLGLNPLEDDDDEFGYGEDSDYVIRIKKPKRKKRNKGKNDIATMMKFANEVIRNLDLTENEGAITLDFSKVTDFSNAKLYEVKIGNDDEDGDEKK